MRDDTVERRNQEGERRVRSRRSRQADERLDERDEEKVGHGSSAVK